MINSLHALSVKCLFSSDYLKMKDTVIRETTMTYKTTVEGEDHVCDAVQQYAEKSYNNGRTEGISIAVKALLNLVGKGIITIDAAVLDSGLNKEELYSIAETLGYKL